jgi:hypothetical protein
MSLQAYQIKDVASNLCWTAAKVNFGLITLNDCSNKTLASRQIFVDLPEFQGTSTNVLTTLKISAGTKTNWSPQNRCLNFRPGGLTTSPCSVAKSKLVKGKGGTVSHGKFQNVCFGSYSNSMVSVVKTKKCPSAPIKKRIIKKK